MIVFIMCNPGHDDMNIFRTLCGHWGNTPETLITTKKCFEEQL